MQNHMHEEQVGGKQYFVGQTTVVIMANFQLDVAKNTEKEKNQRFLPCSSNASFDE